MSKVTYVTLSDYLKIQSHLTDELKLDRSKLRFTNITKQNRVKYEVSHKVRMNVYLEVDTNWLKDARKCIKKYEVFDILKDDKKFLASTNSIKNEFLEF